MRGLEHGRRPRALAALGIAAILGACGGGSTASDSPEVSDQASAGQSAEASVPAEPVEISFLVVTTPNLTEEVWNGFIDDFESKNPGITVELVFGTESTDATARQLMVSDNLPDVQWNMTVSDFVAAGALAEIPIDEDVERIRGYETQLFDGKLYNLSGVLQPFNLVYYNKTLFEEAGITEPPVTWDDFDAAVEKLQAAGIAPLILPPDTPGFQPQQFIANDTFGGEPCWNALRSAGEASFTDPDGIAASAQRFASLVASGAIENAAGYDFQQAQQAFLEGRGAMFMNGVWYTVADSSTDHDFETGAFLTPVIEGDPVILGSVAGSGWTVSATSEHLDAAIALAKYFVFDPETAATFLEADGLFSVLEPPITYDYTPLQQEVFDLTQSPTIVVNGSETAGGDCSIVPGGGQVWIDGGTALLQGNDDVETIMADMDAAWDEAVEQAP